MKTKVYILWVAFLVLITDHSTNAQKNAKIQFGKVVPASFQIGYKHIDSNATAVVVYDGGNTQCYSEIDYLYTSEPLSRLGTITQRHVRIKVIDSAGIKHAFHDIILQADANSKHRITRINGYIFRLANGQISKERLDTGPYLDRQNQKNIRVRFPAVIPGDILDLQYTLQTDTFYSPIRWSFQHPIPTLVSEFSLVYPEWIHITQHAKGLNEITAGESKVITHSPEVDQIRVTDLSKDELVTKSFQAKDIPAFTDENFISNTNNYLSSLEFNIKSMDHPTMGKVSFSQTWDQQIQSLLQNEDYFPDEYSRYVLDCNQALSAYQEITELLPRAFTLVRDQIGWNKRHGIAASKPIKFIKENQSTNVAGKNLLLYQLLKSLNIDAKPVLISTIEHGWVFPSIATLQDFNYLIVQVKLPGKTIFLDASQPDNLYGSLRRECLNGPGLLLDENHGQWIDILPSSASGTKQKIFKLNLYPESEHFTGTYRMNFSGHQAQEFNTEINKQGSIPDIMENLETDLTTSAFDSVSYNLAALKPLIKVRSSIEIDGQFNYEDSLFSFKPLFFEAKDQNPFSSTKRIYPVEFIIPVHEEVYSQIKIPSGCEIISLPEKVITTIKNNAGQFSYEIKKINDKHLLVISKLDINRTVFLPEDYHLLQEFFQKIINKHQEEIVLRK